MPGVDGDVQLMANHLLVADDDTDVRSLVSMTLRSVGHKVTEARDGDQAIALLDSTRFDLAVLDVGMPGASGIEVVRHLRLTEDGEQTMVMLLTALSTRADIRRGYAAGADDYLAKPFSVAELIQRVGALLDERQFSV